MSYNRKKQYQKAVLYVIIEKNIQFKSSWK